MKERIKNLIRSVVPRWVLGPIIRRFFRVRWTGEFASWAQALQFSHGYDQAGILQKILNATIQVRDGAAAFERDGMTFDSPSPDRMLLAALKEVNEDSEAGLQVLDFGGSLGSNYWRHRVDWSDWEPDYWDVVEQRHFVQAGRKHLQKDDLRFFETVEEAELGRSHNVLLCSGTLQYLEDPMSTLDAWGRGPWRYLLLHNLPLHREGPNRVRIQHVPPRIYAASYPVWFFNRADFIAQATRHWRIVKEYPSEAVWPVDGGEYQSTGLLLRKK